MTKPQDRFKGARVIVFDLETKTLIPDNKDLSNEEKIAPMEISAGAYWDSKDNQIQSFSEKTIDKFIAVLREADLVVSYNSLGFDYLVLNKYLDYDMNAFEFPTWDMLERLKESLRYRPALDRVAKATLGRGKTGSGANAPDLYQRRQWAKLEQYVKADVEITKDVFYHAVNNGFLNHVTQKGKKVVIDTKSWAKEIQRIANKTPVLPGDWVVAVGEVNAKSDHKLFSCMAGLTLYDLSFNKIEEVDDLCFEIDAEDTMVNFHDQDGIGGFRREILCRVSCIDKDPEDECKIYTVDEACWLPYESLSSNYTLGTEYNQDLDNNYGNLYISTEDFNKFKIKTVLEYITKATKTKFEIKRYGRSNVSVRRTWN